MSKQINKIFSMIQTELKSEKVELEKVELARKPQSILNETKTLDKALAKYSSTIDRTYVEYVKAHRKFDQEIEQIQQSLKNLKGDVLEVEKTLKDLGLDSNSVPDLKEAETKIDKLENISKDYKKLYPKI